MDTIILIGIIALVVWGLAPKKKKSKKYYNDYQKQNNYNDYPKQNNYKYTKEEWIQQELEKAKKKEEQDRKRKEKERDEFTFNNVFAKTMINNEEIEITKMLHKDVVNELNIAMRNRTGGYSLAYLLCSQVACNSFLGIKKNELNAWHTFNSKYVDFVIFDYSTQKPILVIEYWGGGHYKGRGKDNQSVVESDNTKIKLFRKAGIKLLIIENLTESTKAHKNIERCKNFIKNEIIKILQSDKAYSDDLVFKIDINAENNLNLPISAYKELL